MRCQTARLSRAVWRGSRRASLPEVETPVHAEAQFTEVTVPAGTTLALALDHELASDVSEVEDAVRAQITRQVMADEMLAIPEGSMVVGTVTTVEASRKMQGRAKLAFRFDHIHINSHRYEIGSDTVSYQAEGTKTEDAKKIGIGAGTGVVIGGVREPPWC